MKNHRSRRSVVRARSTFRPQLEALEDRLAPAAAGMLDPTWGADGILATDFASSNETASALALQSDGKIVVAGGFDFGGFSDFAVVRYNPDGRLDTSFSGDGKLTTSLGSRDDRAAAVAVQADGKIVAAGYFDNGSDDDFAVIRYHADGTLDTSFGGTGKVTQGYAAGTQEQANAVAVQSDGKIVVAGYTNNGNQDVIAVMRFNTDGSLDTSFGSNGQLTTDITSGGDVANALAVQSDGKIVVAGEANHSFDPDFAVVRYRADGSLDTSFNGTGKLTTAVGSFADVAHALAVQPDGKIVVAGDTFVGAFDYDFAVVRYRADGSLDTSFNGTGKQITPFGSNTDTALSVAVQFDGKIVAVGYSDNGIKNDFAVVRYNANGDLDTTFAFGGKLTTPVGAGGAVATALAVQSDGKIVVAGDSSNGSNRDFALVRYRSDGSLDRLSDGTGKLTTTFSPVNGNEQANAVAVQSDGKIVVAGYYSNGAANAFAVARYHADGSLDTSFNNTLQGFGDNIGARAYAVAVQPDGMIVVAGIAGVSGNYDFAVMRLNTHGFLDVSFGNNGRVITSIGPNDDQATAVAVQPDGKIVVGGYSYNGSDYDFAVVRYRANGTLDNSFSGDGKVTASVTFAKNDFALAMAVQSDGKIVLVGDTDNGSSYDFAVVRFDSLGSLDVGFDGDGRRTTPIGSGNDVGRSVAVQEDGKIVVAGDDEYAGNARHIAVVRYNADGSPDSSFDGDGKLLTPFGTSDDVATSLAVQSDGKIVVAGDSYNGSNYDIAVARYNADGSLDTTFDGDGKFTTPIGSAIDEALAMALQPDGRIVVAGYAFNGSNNDFAVVRLRGDNRAPVPVPTTLTVQEDVALSVDFPSYFYDPDNDVVATTLLNGPAHGTLTLTAYGQFTYTPFANFNGSDAFSYRLSDSYGGASEGAVQFTVTAVNDAPVANADVVATNEDTPLTLAVLLNDSDAENDVLTVILVGGGQRHRDAERQQDRDLHAQRQLQRHGVVPVQAQRRQSRLRHFHRHDRGQRRQRPTQRQRRRRQRQ